MPLEPFSWVYEIEMQLEGQRYRLMLQLWPVCSLYLTPAWFYTGFKITQSQDCSGICTSLASESDCSSHQPLQYKARQRFAGTFILNLFFFFKLWNLKCGRMWKERFYFPSSEFSHQLCWSVIFSSSGGPKCMKSMNKILKKKTLFFPPNTIWSC